MKLRELLAYDTIVIQAHDNPDADALASGFGLYLFFQAKGKSVRFVYGGANAIQKSNLLLMKELLHIPAEHVQRIDPPDLLLTVDCQYGETNVQLFPAAQTAVIDHHIPRSEGLPALREIRENYGSCATLVWDMLNEEGFDIFNCGELSTALYYGLYMDTGKMQELRHPKDRDLRDALEFRANKALLTRFVNCNLRMEELRVVGDAMLGIDNETRRRYAVALAQRCDPNILGIISDAAIEVDTIDVCVVCCVMDQGVKLSLRSCERETRADELAAYLTEGLGSGGGHLRKAGGFLSLRRLEETCREAYGGFSLESAGLYACRLLKDRLETYFSEQDILQSGTEEAPDMNREPLYEKKRLPMGYVKATDLFPTGTTVVARMLEGDIQFTIREDTYFVIGVEGEVYKNDEAYLLSHNTITDDPYTASGDYAPTLHAAVRSAAPAEEDMQAKRLTDYAKVCVPKWGSRVHARPLARRTKVFVPWSDSYMLGLPGDFLAAREENPKDIYIIKKDIMEKGYAQCQ